MLFPIVPLSVKQPRVLLPVHVSGWHAPPGHSEATLQVAPPLPPPAQLSNASQSALLLQGIIVALGTQKKSIGPAAHTPSLPVVGVQVPSAHAFGAVAWPGVRHVPPWHSPVVMHAW